MSMTGTARVEAITRATYKNRKTEKREVSDRIDERESRRTHRVGSGEGESTTSVERLLSRGAGVGEEDHLALRDGVSLS